MAQTPKTPAKKTSTKPPTNSPPVKRTPRQSQKPKQKDLPVNHFIEFPELKISYFFTVDQDNEDDTIIMMRLNSEKYSGTVVEISKFRFINKKNNNMTFDYTVITNPNKLDVKDVELVKNIKMIVKKLITLAIETACEKELNDSRKSNLKKSS